MHASLTVFRYPKANLFVAFWAMALFRVPLMRKRGINFSRLLGTGLNGTFDIHPDYRQWAILTFFQDPPDIGAFQQDRDGMLTTLYGGFIVWWLNYFNCETWTVVLEVSDGHGSWDGKTFIRRGATKVEHVGPVAVLTRATIRLSRLRHFWKHVAPVSRRFFDSAGLRVSIGIGELPLVRQATFTIWDSMAQMRDFAYRSTEHREVIQKTRSEKWYSEEMFLRFKPLFTSGTIGGENPFPLP